MILGLVLLLPSDAPSSTRAGPNFLALFEEIPLDVPGREEAGDPDLFEVTPAEDPLGRGGARDPRGDLPRRKDGPSWEVSRRIVLGDHRTAVARRREVASSVDRALEWLARHQDRERGHWDPVDFRARCEANVCSGRGAEWCGPGETGLAVLAFLGAGHSHALGRYRDTVQRGLRYLLSIQDEGGCFGPRLGHFMYNHAIATLAVVRAYGSTRSPLVRDAARRGVDFLLEARNPGYAWRYKVRHGDNDTSVTGWAFLALTAGKRAGLDVPGEAFDGAIAWLETATDPLYFRTSYMPRGDYGTVCRFSVGKFAPAETCTAISIVCRGLHGTEPHHPLLVGQGDLLGQNLPSWDPDGAPGGTSRIDFYYWHFGTLATSRLGGDVQSSWISAVRKALEPNQRLDGDERGSWDPIDAWGSEGGRIYATAINAITLQICHGYDRAVE